MAASKSSSFSQSLQFITSIKLQELEKQRLAYRTHSAIIERANAAGDDHISKVEILLEGIRSWTGSGSVSDYSDIGGKLNLRNISYWLKQAKNDPSFSIDIVKDWADTLEDHVRHNMMRFDCAKLFGTLFNEWLSSGDSSTVQYQTAIDECATDASFEVVDGGRKELFEQREKLESIIFQGKPVETYLLTKYLDGLFSGEEGEKALQKLKEDIRSQGDFIRRRKLATANVRNTIKGLLSTGLMDEEKRATLKEFLDNSTVLEEVTSVLNMRLSSLESWTWPAEGILVEMRRHLNGKYRAFTDPEIIDALLLHYLGTTWQVNLKQALDAVYYSNAWKGKELTLSRLELEKRKGQVPKFDEGASIDSKRNAARKEYFFLSQLSDTMGGYDDLVDAPEVAGDAKETSPAQVKQKLLHIMTTECYLNTALRGSFAVVRSDLEWFGPSLSHEAILTVLEYFGFTKEWLAFFRTFLRAPLRFSGDATPQIRQCGTPISYALSAVCGEAVLFAMDFAVNQRADGLFLYRMHDDLWIWDSDPAKCAIAWKEMNIYAQHVGLKFNEKKTGSAYVGNGTPVGLPAGDIRWGFLKFDASAARFIIDKKDVDSHIDELKRQLAFTKSVFGWVNAYNKYMTFFLRNFGGSPARCFSEAHIDSIVQTLARIQRELFPGENNSAVGYLRKVFEQRFGVKDLPEGYFYFPISNGGLELRNTMLDVLAIRIDNKEYPAQETFLRGMKKDAEDYKDKKKHWEVYGRSASGNRFNEFMSFEEYLSLRESWLEEWSNDYDEMLQVPRPESMTASPALDAMLAGSKDRLWNSKNWYFKWILALYGEELVKKFGGLEIVDPTLIPVGMVELFRSSRMKLDQ